VYPYTLAACSPMVWPLVFALPQPDCLLSVYQCTRMRSPHAPPWPGHPSSRYLNLTVRSLCTSVPVYPHTLAASSSPLAWPLVLALSQPDCLLIMHQCTRTHLRRPPPWPEHSCPRYLNLTVCSLCTSVPVHTCSVLPPGLATRACASSTRLFAHWVPVYRCTRTHSPHPPPPWPGHSSLCSSS